MSRIVILCLFLVMMSAGLAFHLANDQLITLNYYLGSFDLPVSLVLVLAICIGALMGILACIPVYLRLKRENIRLNRQVTVNEKELNNLRVIPVKDNP